MSIKKALQLTVVIATLIADYYMTNAVVIQAQVSNIMITDKVEDESPSFKSGFKEMTSPLHRVVPAYTLWAPVPDLTYRDLKEA